MSDKKNFDPKELERLKSKKDKQVKERQIIKKDGRDTTQKGSS